MLKELNETEKGYAFSLGMLEGFCTGEMLKHVRNVSEAISYYRNLYITAEQQNELNQTRLTEMTILLRDVIIEARKTKLENTVSSEEIPD